MAARGRRAGPLSPTLTLPACPLLPCINHTHPPRRSRGCRRGRCHSCAAALAAISAAARRRWRLWIRTGGRNGSGRRRARTGDGGADGHTRAAGRARVGGHPTDRDRRARRAPDSPPPRRQPFPPLRFGLSDWWPPSCGTSPPHFGAPPRRWAAVVPHRFHRRHRRNAHSSGVQRRAPRRLKRDGSFRPVVLEGVPGGEKLPFLVRKLGS